MSTYYMVVYDNLEELQKNVAKIALELDCLGAASLAMIAITYSHRY